MITQLLSVQVEIQIHICLALLLVPVLWFRDCLHFHDGHCTNAGKDVQLTHEVPGYLPAFSYLTFTTLWGTVF